MDVKSVADHFNDKMMNRIIFRGFNRMRVHRDISFFKLYFPFESFVSVLKNFKPGIYFEILPEKISFS